MHVKKSKKMPQPYAELLLSWIAAYGAASFDTKLSVSPAAILDNRLCRLRCGLQTVRFKGKETTAIP